MFACMKILFFSIIANIYAAKANKPILQTALPYIYATYARTHKDSQKPRIQNRIRIAEIPPFVTRTASHKPRKPYIPHATARPKIMRTRGAQQSQQTRTCTVAFSRARVCSIRDKHQKQQTSILTPTRAHAPLQKRGKMSATAAKFKCREAPSDGFKWCKYRSHARGAFFRAIFCKRNAGETSLARFACLRLRNSRCREWRRFAGNTKITDAGVRWV